MAFQDSAMTTGIGTVRTTVGARRRARASPRSRRRPIVSRPLRRLAPVVACAVSCARRFSLGVLGSVAAMIVIAIFNPFSAKFGSLSFSSLSLDGTKITMARPKLAGFRSDGQPYSLTAERALQDVKQPTVVELQKLTGDIGMAGGETTHLSADTGVYDSVAEQMRLSDNIRIGNARFDVRLRSADIDFKTGVYQSDEPVEVHVGEGTTISGDRATARTTVRN